ncbi:MAG: sensor histidine kinase [Deltaproteobacteria bacterium]|nr:sensor histidine kinase [Deltaproteobacteria bacterium]
MSTSGTGTPRGGPPDLIDEANRLLLDRIRLGLWLVLAGVAAVFVGELALNHGTRPWISIYQAANWVIGALALAVLHTPARRQFNLAVAFVTMLVTVAATGAVGVAALDATTPVVLMVGLALTSSMLVPCGPGWQLGVVLWVIAVAIWTVASIVPSPRLFWLQYVGTIVPTLAGTVVIAYALQRQRQALDDAERERRARERGLRDANRRLEEEIDQHRRTEETLRFAMRELDHRVKNTLATVQSVADQTLRGAQSLEDFSHAFRGRIQAMARIHSALAGRRWEGLQLGELIELVVGPYRNDRDSVSIDGEGAFLSSDLVRVLGMALHELATNAAKYGALSTKAGRLAISSQVEASDPPRLRICWTERDGPPIGAPTQRGFGMRLIEEALAYEAGGRVGLQFARQGVRSEIEIPLRTGSG